MMEACTSKFKQGLPMKLLCADDVEDSNMEERSGRKGASRQHGERVIESQKTEYTQEGHKWRRKMRKTIQNKSLSWVGQQIWNFTYLFCIGPK
jgi:hypothetical protein